jgi:hydroxymethylbilane synthase
MRLGTRGSPLALAQARLMAEALRGHAVETTIVPMRTEGDRLQEARLAAVGGKGLFVREIEGALLAGTIDAAVHSLKDLPAELPEGLMLDAFPERADPRDVLVTRAGGGVDDLPHAAVVGTSSPRRRALLLAARPDLDVRAIRGNVDTRLRKLEEADWDAIVLAAAGLGRLALRPRHVTVLPPERFVPAVGQGIIGLEVRRDDRQTRALIAALDHAPTRVCARAERAFLQRLGASCNTPTAAHARLTDGRVAVTGVVASEDGRHVLRADVSGPPDAAESLGRGLAETLLAQGAASVVPLNAGGGG